MKKIAVYCGSRSGHSSLYQEQAIEMGKVLAKNNIGLIYGGGAIGLMGCIADTVLEHHGHVIGGNPNILRYCRNNPPGFIRIIRYQRHA